MLRFAAIASLVWLATSSLALAAGNDIGDCALSPDKSSIIVTASNGDARSYQCTAFCRAHVTGARPFDHLNCNYILPKGANQKVVCTKNGGKPNYYSDILPTRATCVPR